MELFKALPCLVLGLLTFVMCSFAYDPATCVQCRQSHMCNPPDCFCCRDKMPLKSRNIPQMVFFSFDDAVNPQVATFYRQLFNPKRLNPNGCPISMTLFVSHRNTVYGLVKEFYQNGIEIASHSVTHSHMNTNTFIREARKQKENLSKRAGIPSGKITGWRSPFLEPVGDLQPSVLKDLGYEYDATLTMAKKDPKDKAITPFTLDFGWPYDCKIKPCPTKAHKGFWEVPVVSVKDYLNKYDCVYVDGCNNPPPTENLAYKFLWDNFQKYYTTNRAPMGINMHASWFYYPDRKAAMDRFIKELIKLDDVYIVSIKQVIEWLKDPTSLEQIKTFQPWQCSGNKTSEMESKPSQSRSSRQRSRDVKFRPKSTHVGNFISNIPQPSIPVRSWQTPRPRGQQRLPTTIPAPIPPMVPNLPMVRFWWRPPGMVNRNLQAQRQDNLRRQMLERERLRRIQAEEEQARLIEQKRQMEARKQEQARLLEQKRQEELRQQKEAKLLEQQRQEKLRQQEQARLIELKRKEELRQQEQARLLEQKRQEKLRQQEQARLLEQQRQEKLKQQEQARLLEQQRQEKLKQQEQARLLEQKRQENLKQQEQTRLLEQQRQEKLMQQEQARLLEQQRQEKLKQQEQAILLEQQRQEKLKQQEQARLLEQQRKQEILLEKQHLEKLKQQEQTRVQLLEKQHQEELRQQELARQQQLGEFQRQEVLMQQQSFHAKPKLTIDENLHQNELGQKPTIISGNSLQNEFLPVSDVVNGNLLQNEFLPVPDATNANLLQNEFLATPGAANGNLLQNEFLTAPGAANGNLLQNEFLAAPGAANGNLLQNEFLTASGAANGNLLQNEFLTAPGAANGNLLQNEFLTAPSAAKGNLLPNEFLTAPGAANGNLLQNEFLTAPGAANGNILQNEFLTAPGAANGNLLQNEFLTAPGAANGNLLQNEFLAAPDAANGNLLQNEFLPTSNVNRDNLLQNHFHPMPDATNSNLHQIEFLSSSGAAANANLLQNEFDPAPGAGTGNLLQNEFLATSGVANDNLLQNEFLATPDSASSKLLQNEFLQAPGVTSSNFIQNEFLAAPDAATSNLLQNEFFQAPGAATSNLLQNEFLQASAATNNNYRQNKFLPAPDATNGNLLQNEFLQGGSNEPTRTTSVEQPLIQNRNFQNVQDTVKKSQNLQQEVTQQSFTQPPPLTTIDHNQVLEKSFQVFISRKLDDILGHRPSERTQQLELLSMGELKALQEELRTRLVTSKHPKQENIQKQKKTTQSASAQTNSDVMMDIPPMQNEITPWNKPVLQEFHVPSNVKVTKIDKLQTKQIMANEAVKEIEAPFVEPFSPENRSSVLPFVETTEATYTEWPAASTSVSDQTTTYISTTQAVTTQTMPSTATFSKSATPTPSPTTTFPTTAKQLMIEINELITQSTTRETTPKPATSTTQRMTTTTMIPTTTSTQQPITAAAKTTPNPTTQKFTKPLTTTTVTTTTIAPSSTTTTTTTTATTNKPTMTTKKTAIPVKPMWTVSEHMKVPWQRWITRTPGVVRIETTTPRVSETPQPSTRIQFFTVQDLKKTSHSFNEQPFNLLPSKSQNANNRLNTNSMQKSTSKVRVRPTAFVNSPKHFDINGPQQRGIFTGINPNGNRFLSSFDTFSPKIVTKTTEEQSFIETTTSLPTTDVQQIAKDAVNFANKFIVQGNKPKPEVPVASQQNRETVPPPDKVWNASPIQTNSPVLASECTQNVNCMRPNCVCKDTRPPNGIKIENTPQIVYITIDGSLNFHTYGKMRSLFSRGRKNPNGCRIKGTVFITDTGSSYRIANALKTDGIELAMMGISSRPYTDSTTLKKDLVRQRKRIAVSANIAPDEVIGWRSPGLSPVGDEQYNILANQSLYDSSLLLPTNTIEKPIPWPHTLDFKWKDKCQMGKCPKQYHSGVWEVPAIPFNGPKNLTSCEYIDACANQPGSEQETIDFLMKNFNEYYKTNKAPFAIRLKQMWFHWFYRENFSGLLKFLDKILGFGDVYITSVSDMLEWMKTPKTLKDLNQFDKWKC